MPVMTEDPEGGLRQQGRHSPARSCALIPTLLIRLSRHSERLNLGHAVV